MMEARLKKILHRRKDGSTEEQGDGFHSSSTNSGLPSSLYDAAPSGEPPKIGTHALRGNEGVSLPPYRHETRGLSNLDHIPSSPSAPYGQHQGSNAIPRKSARTPNDSQLDSSRASEHHVPGAWNAHDGRSPQLPDIPISQGFSAFRLGPEDEPRHSPQTRYSPYVPASASIMAAGGNTTNQRMTSRRPVNHTDGGGSGPSEPLDNVQDGRRKKSLFSSATIYDPEARESKEQAELTRSNSIPRKQVGSPSRSEISGLHSASPKSHFGDPSLSHDLDFRAGKGQTSEYGDSSSSPIGLNKLRLTAKDAGVSRETGRILEKAQTDSADTEVIESMAPALVHETVRPEVHHIREEHITREIHNHDIYHRILPIIDVEVLPPRHFLPVEGGGLVEISADEVPGRGKHWVVAETASKISSDQPAPRTTNRFSAREFIGSEGDSRRYITPEGYERTEDTWVHPPELEVGGRDTGQTWPMVFDPNVDQKSPSGERTSKSGKKRHSKKPSSSRPSMGE